MMKQDVIFLFILIGTSEPSYIYVEPMLSSEEHP